jgi:MoxR-like ATPase
MVATLKTKCKQMDIASKVIKLLFGSKADKDRKQIEPYVQKIKDIYPSIQKLTNDELREHSAALMRLIADFIAADEAHIVEEKHRLEHADISLSEKEKISKDIEATTKRIDEKIEQYIADIVFATRFPDKYGMKEMKDYISFGASPRASINLALASRAYAFIKRRGYVVPEDVRAVAHDVLRHRIGLSYEAEASNMTSDEIVSLILNRVEVP